VPSKKNQVSFKVGRDAASGRFVTVATAQKRKKAAIVQTITRPKGKRRRR